MSLQDRYRALGAALAGDGIPLHFGDITGEYAAAIEGAVLLDRSHEGRVMLTGGDRFELPNRMSTNHLLDMADGSARPTLFLNATGRILERAVAANWHPDADTPSLLMLGGPGRGPVLHRLIQRNIFFNDDVQANDVTASTVQFDLHGPRAGEVIAALDAEAADLDIWQGRRLCQTGPLADLAPVFALRQKPCVASHWTLITSVESAPVLWDALIAAGMPLGMKPSGGLVFNALRIRSGVPGTGRELNGEYIPLEIGLWDEVSFTKGCYTGQEIIARMESRHQLAKTLVALHLDAMVDAPADVFAEGKRAGQLTSSVTAPDGAIYGMAVVRVAHAQPGTGLTLGTPGGPVAHVDRLLGVQPAWVTGR